MQLFNEFQHRIKKLDLVDHPNSAQFWKNSIDYFNY